MSWDAFVTYTHELNTFSVFLRLLIASISGAVLGIDRARKNRPAGSRTHMLVCIGAALVMITSQFLFNNYGGGDPARLGAQVISGIGFLGAGTIIVTSRNQVVGLTTAAGLWVDACIGLAIGSGFYSASIMAVLFLMFIMVVMQGIDDKMQTNSRYMQLFVEFRSPSHLSTLLGYASQNGMAINAVEIVEARNAHDHQAAIIDIKLSERIDHQIVIEGLRKVEGIEFISKL